MTEQVRLTMEDRPPVAGDHLSHRLEKAREIGRVGEDPAAESLKRRFIETSQPDKGAAVEKAAAGE